MRKLFLLFLASLSISGNAQQSGVNSLVNNWITNSMLQGASISVCFRDAHSGDIIADHNADLYLAPASTLKLWSTATAMELLSPDFRFTTELALAGKQHGDTLHGNIIIIGGGDPALGSRYFPEHYGDFLQSWVDSLKQRGIRHINGDIIPDASAYDDAPVPDNWTWDDIGNYYGAGPSGLTAFDNMYEVHFFTPTKVGQPTKILFTTPETGISFDNRTLSSTTMRDLSVIYGSPTDYTRIIKGTLPRGKADFAVRGALPNPPRILAQCLATKLHNSDIAFNGRIQPVRYHRTAADSLAEVRIAATTSPTLFEIAKETNYISVNLFAEHLLMHPAYVKSGFASATDGIRLLKQFWSSKGVSTNFSMYDGSGLARANAVTTAQTTAMLFYMMNKSSYSEQYFQTLPPAPEGTLSYFRKFPDGSLRAKSGSMSGIRSFAGLLRTKSGKELLFHIILNNFRCSQADAISAIEELLLAVRKEN
ncbi:MAG: D-alanyl-D-alanine carboxypeptidase/D-alanyl-D-alanine-endopeptidase [Bacteroidales bacterium]|jgi:D-alanyl-D-alanine carboxypeptidase/D-alanyl-D-alanine-endopeptidase (penicillin-binding protein 4)|nr:D-alanyl-D-alanine carboxypeptidase/D-alanyl-D-alanine-endopeptidase [Bacteroidales bacterium]